MCICIMHNALFFVWQLTLVLRLRSGGETVIAIYDYVAAKPTDLELKKGDIVR